MVTLLWRHNERGSVSDHQPLDCLLKRLFRCRLKKTSRLCVTGLCAGNSPVAGEFPAQRASNAENVSIWWRHHETRPHHYDVPTWKLYRITVPLCGEFVKATLNSSNKGPVMRIFDITLLLARSSCWTNTRVADVKRKICWQNTIWNLSGSPKMNVPVWFSRSWHMIIT